MTRVRFIARSISVFSVVLTGACFASAQVVITLSGANASLVRTSDSVWSLTKTGVKGATIGNIVVNLQTTSGSQWLIASSDVNDATNGDAAATAEVDPGQVPLEVLYGISACF